MFKLHRNAHLAVCCCAALLAACAKKENAAGDTVGAMDTSTASGTTATAQPINLADVAGKWNVRSVPTTGDTTPTTYVLTATNNTSGWTITFPRRTPIPMRVRTDADSIIAEAGPFESVRRKGVQVNTNGVMRLQDGNLVGTTTAHYIVKTADSVLTLTTTGTRVK
jgi:hypothetical protein